MKTAALVRYALQSVLAVYVADFSNYFSMFFCPCSMWTNFESCLLVGLCMYVDVMQWKHSIRVPRDERKGEIQLYKKGTHASQSGLYNNC